MKIAFFEVENWAKEHIAKTISGHELIFFDFPLDSERADFAKDAEGLVVFIYSKLNKELIDKMPKLKFIATTSTGFDHIDTEYCKKKGISVFNVPFYGENTVAEHAFALILALSRKIYPSIKRTAEQNSFESDESLRGFDLKGKTLGLLGCGNIGKHVAKIAKGFDMKVIVFDIYKDENFAKKTGFEYVDMDVLLRDSDIISLHVPYNDKTKHLVNEETIGKMKKGVFVINTSRGGVVDTSAFIKNLESGKIAGAGLDVIEEGYESIAKMNNVIVTPHNAFNSSEAIKRIVDATTDNILSFLAGKPKNIV